MPPPPALADRIRKRHHARLERAWRVGCREHPELKLSCEAFAQAVSRRLVFRLGTRTHDVAVAMDRLAAGDVFLAIACDSRIPHAWDRFTSIYVPLIKAALIKRRVHQSTAEQIARELPGDLLSAPPTGNARTRIGTFDGSASLLSWLSIIAARRAIDLRRAASTVELAPEDALEARIPAPRSSAPIDLIVEHEIGEEWRLQWARAWKQLREVEQKAILYRFHEGLKQETIARLLGFSRSRISRLIQGAIDRLKFTLGRELDLGVDSLDFGRAWRQMRFALEENLHAMQDELDE